MRVIQTYLPTENGTGIDKNYLYTISLSVLLAKKYYENVILYTNEEFAETIKEIGLPYDEINSELLNGSKFKTFSIPKMIVYKNQDKPFIHIDLDTLLFKKYHFDGIDSIYCSFPENFEKISSGQKNDFYHTYIKPTLKIKSKISKEFIDCINFKDVPNMSILAVENTEIMSEAVAYCLEIYEDNREYFDSNFYHACVIEQLFIPSALRMFKKRKKDGRDFLVNFIHKKPHTISFNDDDFNFPFIITQEGGWSHFNSKWEIFKRPMHNFEGFLHLSGHKKIDEIAFMMKLRIMIEFGGYSYLEKIDKLYNEKTECDKLTEDYFYYLKNTMDEMIKNKAIKRKLL